MGQHCKPDVKSYPVSLRTKTYVILEGDVAIMLGMDVQWRIYVRQR